MRPASGGGGPEGEASGVPREACWPGDLASPPDRSPPRAPPLCHPLLLWKPLLRGGEDLEENLRWLTITGVPPLLGATTHIHTHTHTQLQQRQARETGICPVREELYAQCFDELIRQVTLDQPERGLLLMRVRDEI